MYDTNKSKQKASNGSWDIRSSSSVLVSVCGWLCAICVRQRPELTPEGLKCINRPERPQMYK
jgi:hypothetical protein